MANLFVESILVLRIWRNVEPLLTQLLVPLYHMLVAKESLSALLQDLSSRVFASLLLNWESHVFLVVQEYPVNLDPVAFLISVASVLLLLISNTLARAANTTLIASTTLSSVEMMPSKSAMVDTARKLIMENIVVEQATPNATTTRLTALVLAVAKRTSKREDFAIKEMQQ